MKIKMKDAIIFLLILVISFLAANLYVLHMKTGDSEIERKWLVDVKDIPYDLENAEKYEIVQTYINFSPEMRVRKINGESYILTIKSKKSVKGLERTEREYYITEEEYANLLKKQEGRTIYKTRYVVNDDGKDLQIDVFSGELEGLVYLEIEFFDKMEAKRYKSPEWTKKDVTDDWNYKNGHLARFGIPETYEEYMKDEGEGN